MMYREMRLRYIWFIVAALAILFAGSISGERSVRAEESRYDPEEQKFLKLINDYRQGKGLTTLILSDTLTVASERHSEDMGRHNFFAHESLKSSHFPAGSKPWDRMKLSGYNHPNALMAENLAAGYESAQQNFEVWQASPGHNENMLKGDLRGIGIARVNVPGSKHSWYWTTNFGSEAGDEQKAPDKADEEARDLEPEDRDGIENGSMNDDDGVWKQRSAKEGKKLLRNEAARLGGYNRAKDEISQKIRVQEGQNNKLVYKVRILTKERERPADFLLVRFTDEAGKHLATAKSRTSTDARRAGEDGWIRGSADLSRFAGEEVNVGFFAKTDGERPTTFYIDDVALR
jgi:uncharacterized protein YkwD